MAIIRSIEESGIDRFLSEPIKPQDIEAFRSFFNMQLKTGETKLQWCFVLDNGLRFSARILFATFPGMHPEYGAMMFAADESLSNDNCIEFLSKTTEMMKSLIGASIFTLEARTSSINYQRHVSLFRSAGFEYSSARTRYNLDLQVNTPTTIMPMDFTEVSADQAGEEEFIRGLGIITSNSLDTEDRLRIEQFGVETAAKNFYVMERSRDTSIEKWKLFYTQAGNFAGLVIPQFFGNNKEQGTIGHIGIDPSIRGKGFGRAILSRAHKILADEGVVTMVDECDILNVPAAKILLRTGYMFQYQKEYYKKVLL